MLTSFTTTQAAVLLLAAKWQIQRVYERGDVPEPERFAGRRVIPREHIPLLVDALRSRGWLPSPDSAEASQ